MMALLRNGRIPKPPSLAYAQTRCKNLEREIARIGEQLADDARRQRFTSASAYREWHQRAKKAQENFAEELRQYREWIVKEEDSGRGLLREVDVWLRRLEKEIDLEPDESELARRVRKFLEGC